MFELAIVTSAGGVEVVLVREVDGGFVDVWGVPVDPVSIVAVCAVPDRAEVGV